MTACSARLLAQAPVLDWSMVVYSGLLALALIVGAWLIALAGKWRRANATRTELLSPSEQLAQFRLLYDQGAISQEEFDRLRNLLGNQMRQALDLPATNKTTEGHTAEPHPQSPAPSPPSSGQPAPPPDGVHPA